MQKDRNMNKNNSSSKNRLKLNFLELGKIAFEMGKEGLKKRKLRPYIRPFMRFKATESGFVGKEFEKADWTSASFIVVHDMEKLSLYKKTINRIKEFHSVDSDKATHWLSRFIQHIVHMYLEKDVSDEALVDYVKIVLRDMEGAPYEFNIVVNLQGLSVERSKIELDENTVLRKPEPKDFESEIEIEESRRYMMRRPSAFLDLKIIAQVPPGVVGPGLVDRVTPAIEKAVAALRLFKVGVVHHIGYQWSAKTIIGLNSGSIIPNISVVENPSSFISESDVEPLKRFWIKIKKHIPVEVARYWLAERASYLTIAFQRYSDALLRDGIAERRIAIATMGLEALYLHGGPELKYRLRMRVAKFLDFLGFNSIQVQKELGEAYDVRSDFVHGRLKKEKRKHHAELLKTVLEYLRVSLIAFLLLKKYISKEDIIKLIDKAMINMDADAEFKDKLVNIQDFI